MAANLAMPWPTAAMAWNGGQVIYKGGASAEEYANALLAIQGYGESLGFKASGVPSVDPQAEFNAHFEAHLKPIGIAEAHKLGDGTIVKALGNLPWGQILSIILQLTGALGGLGGAPVSGS
jgi:hypothetical protein